MSLTSNCQDISIHEILLMLIHLPTIISIRFSYRKDGNVTHIQYIILFPTVEPCVSQT